MKLMRSSLVGAIDQVPAQAFPDVGGGPVQNLNK